MSNAIPTCLFDDDDYIIWRNNSTDLIGRKFLMSSWLYYTMSESVLNDFEFDDMGVYLSDNWDELSPTMKFLLNNRIDIRSSGFSVNITRATIGGAMAWLEKSTGRKIKSPVHGKWKINKDLGFDYSTL